MNRLFFCIFSLAVTAIGQADELPPAADREIDFHTDVVPILYRSCTKCHTGEKPKGGLRLETRELLLAGGDSGDVVEVGKSGASLLIELVSGGDEDRIMPNQGPRLTAEQIGVLRAWIDQGLKWDDGFRFGSTRQARLEPRRVKLPSPEQADGSTHPIDRLMAAYFRTYKIEGIEEADDRIFIRRAYLDLTGLLPPPEAVEHFENDADDDTKHARLIDSLLANKQAYAVHWLTFWNDALRNAYRGTGYIDGGRQQITPWLYRSLHENKPYNQFVHELISPVGGSEGFIKGLVWRGVVNASQRPEMQAAQNVSQVFLGTNLKCASCHDSFINDWKLSDSYALAAVFADGPLEIHRCNKPTGKFAEVGFIYPQLGEVDAKANKPERMQQLADVVTGQKNGRLARTIVNRLWAQLFGRGIIEPVDDLDQPPMDEDLLDWLALDLAEHGYDVKHTLRLICTSRAYRLQSVGAPRPEETEFVFRGPLVKRMTAEQFVDGVSTLSNNWPNAAAVSVPENGGQHIRAALLNDDPLTRALGRTNREQVVTRRDTLATTLQLLELSNGSILDAKLNAGAHHWHGQKFDEVEQRTNAIYQQALGRDANKQEHAVAAELLGESPTPAGIADLLWVVVMLPEFQLIY